MSEGMDGSMAVTSTTGPPHLSSAPTRTRGGPTPSPSLLLLLSWNWTMRSLAGAEAAMMMSDDRVLLAAEILIHVVVLTKGTNKSRIYQSRYPV